MGGAIAKADIATFNEDVDNQCSYCYEATSTSSHTIWVCKYFNQTRYDTDPQLASVPIRYLLQCIQCGIARAMETKGNATYWGQYFAEYTQEDTKKLLGYEPTLTMEARDGDETEARRQALQILQNHDMQGLNARQLMLRQKQAQGDGANLVFPDDDEINKHTS